MSKIWTARESCGLHNIIEVEVGTTAPDDPDAYKGGKTYISLKNAAGTHWKVKVKGYPSDEGGEFEYPDEITLILEGASEAQSIAEALLFAGWRLMRQIAAPAPYDPSEDTDGFVEV